MNSIYNNIYLSNIVVFLTYNDIIALSICNKALKRLLEPKNNPLINKILIIN